jgi:hypothetical protein
MTGGAASVGELALLAESFRRALKAANRSPRTVETYLEAVKQLDAFLARTGGPRAVREIRREHVEGRRVARHSPLKASGYGQSGLALAVAGECARRRGDYDRAVELAEQALHRTDAPPQPVGGPRSRLESRPCLMPATTPSHTSSGRSPLPDRLVRWMTSRTHRGSWR